MKTFTLILLLALTACARRERLAEQPAEATAQIQRWIPVGTDVLQARRIIEEHQFTCSVVANGSFGQARGIDYLYCDHRSSGLVHRRWQVALVIVDEKISAVHVTTGLIGP